MFSISHFYISSKVLGRKSSLLALGCALPDMRIVLRNDSPLASLHSKTEELNQFIEEKYPELKDLAMAMKLHTVQANFNGADYYSDDLNVGYALKKGEVIRQEVGVIIGDNGRNGQKLAHNFIEAALELELIEYDKNIGPEYETLMENVDIGPVVKCLGEFFNVNENEVRRDVRKLMNHLSFENSSSEDSLAPFFVGLTDKRYGVKIKNLSVITGLISRSRGIIKDSFVEFYKKTIEAIKKDLESESGI